MSRRNYEIDLSLHHKLIVGEGESDRNFLAEFCVQNNIGGFDYAFTGMHDPAYRNSGFGVFYEYLKSITYLRGFDDLADIVLLCDSTDKPEQRIGELRGQIVRTNKALGSNLYDESPQMNVVAKSGAPRLHVLMIPPCAQGGLESVCVDVARDHLDTVEANCGTTIQGWVNTFADLACEGWTVEKRDKLRLQAMMSAAWKKKPELHFSQLFDITRSKFLPLTGPGFSDIRAFLKQVETL